MRLVRHHDFELVDLLVEAERLEQRMRLGQPQLVRIEAAAPDSRRLQRALIEHHAEQVCLARVGQHIGPIRGLRIPDAVELVFEHLPLRIEIVARPGRLAVRSDAVVGIDIDADAHMAPRARIVAAPLGEERAERARARALHLQNEPILAERDGALLVVVLAVRLAVALEAAALL